MIPGIVAGRPIGGGADPIALAIYNKLFEWWTFNNTGVGSKAGVAYSSGTSLGFAGGKVGDAITTGTRATGVPAVSGFGAAGCSLFGWVRPTTTTSRVLMSMGRNQSGGEIIVIDYVAGAIGAGYRDSVSVGGPSRITAALNTWHFFVVSWKPGVPSGTIELSLNAGAPGTALKTAGSELTPQYFEQGSVYSNTDAGAMFDEVGFTVGALTAEEIAYLFGSGDGIGYEQLASAAGH